MCSLRQLALALALAYPAMAQDSTATIRGVVSDATGARIAAARVTTTRADTGFTRDAKTGPEGEFVLPALPPGDYTVRIEATGFATQVRGPVHADVGGASELRVTLTVGGGNDTVTVSDEAPLVETQPSGVSAVITAREIEEVPLNGRRFQDLALQTPGVTQDPRGLTASSNGDLAFGGIRGYQSTFYVDGVDNNNAFFAQARGRYRAPYQFSNEFVQEFRVSSNTYGAELGRAGGAVINVVTKSGTNQLHGSAFYYLRSSDFGARHPFLAYKPADRQHQFGFTLGGRLARNRAYFYLGLDQHIFHVPTAVRFADGSAVLTPTPDDYEVTDQTQVFAAAAQLSSDIGGDFRSKLLGNAALAKVEYTISPKHSLSARVSVSRFYGQNNVFFDPASPVTNRGISENGEERVSTESAAVTLTSALSLRAISTLRVQSSRDLQESVANSDEVRTRIADVIEGFGRSSILPRQTREQRWHIAETISLHGRRHTWKFGGDALLTRIHNFFPSLFGGQYIFDDIRVNPFTFRPAVFGLRITPLRAYAHNVPRYYIQNFGESVSRPDSNDFSLFAQDTIRVTDNLALSLGVRWDLQTFPSNGLETNPLWPESGKLPRDRNNIAPRAGFAYSLGEKRPLVVRGGYGIFYTRIPQIYTSAVEMENGLKKTHLFLDNADFFDNLLFPTYPGPLVSCPAQATSCAAPGSVAANLTTEISAFAPGFQTPFVQQASLTAERELANRLALSVSYLYVHGQHLMRARDVNLPPPTTQTYPVFDDNGVFTGQYYTVDSFATWQMAPSISCPFPPCINDVVRPIPQVESITQFESAVSSVYHGLTASLLRRTTNGLFYRVSYTYATAMDDGQDALVAGRPSLVQNSYAASSERGRSATDQRHRLAVAWAWEPRPFHRDRPMLKALFNDWKIAGTVTMGSGRPVNARIAGDANRDNNDFNDRLPGVRRNSFTGPAYYTTDLRLTRRLFLRDRVTLDALVESFNVFNHANRRLTSSDDGSEGSAASFVQRDTMIGANRYPAQYRVNAGFLQPTNAYAPRQVQLGLRLKW